MPAATSETNSVLDEAPLGSFQIRTTLLCAVVAMLDGFDTQSIAYVAPRIAADWRLPIAAFGPIFGAGLLGLAIGAFVLSPIADRFGRKVVILGSVFVFGALALLMARAGSANELLLLRLLAGVGLGGAMPNIIALTNEYAPSRYKATLVTIMFCGFPLGSTLGGFATVPLIEAYGWRSVFLIGGIMPLALLPVLMLLMPDSARFLAIRGGAERRIAHILDRIVPGTSTAEFIAAARAGHDAGRRLHRFPAAQLFAHGYARRTLLIWLACFMNLLVMYALVNWLPSLLSALGLPLRIAILSTALLNLGGVVGGIVLGRLIDQGKAYRTLALAYFAAAGFIAVIAFAGSNVVLLLGAAIGAGMGVSGAQTGLNAVNASLYPTTVRVTAIGWALGVGRLGSILGPTIGGVLLGWGWHPQALLLVTLAPALIAAGAVLALRRA